MWTEGDGGGLKRLQGGLSVPPGWEGGDLHQHPARQERGHAGQEHRHHERHLQTDWRNKTTSSRDSIKKNNKNKS